MARVKTSGTGGKVSRKRAAPRAAQAKAKKLAARMPLVHFPARATFEDWTTHWAALSSNRARGMQPAGTGPFARLRNEHVFLYAGPSCYFNSTCIGDSILYFAAGAESGSSGGASPFDSGSLEDPTPKLRPWAERAEAARWALFSKHAVKIADFRARLQRWLAASYDDPDRYLDTQPDRYAAGLPDRSRGMSRATTGLFTRTPGES